jgi:hypothetical protein
VSATVFAVSLILATVTGLLFGIRIFMAAWGGFGAGDTETTWEQRAGNRTAEAIVVWLMLGSGAVCTLAAVMLAVCGIWAIVRAANRRAVPMLPPPPRPGRGAPGGIWRRSRHAAPAALETGRWAGTPPGHRLGLKAVSLRHCCLALSAAVLAVALIIAASSGAAPR